MYWLLLGFCCSASVADVAAATPGAWTCDWLSAVGTAFTPVPVVYRGTSTSVQPAAPARLAAPALEKGAAARSTALPRQRVEPYFFVDVEAACGSSVQVDCATVSFADDDGFDAQLSKTTAAACNASTGALFGGEFDSATVRDDCLRICGAVPTCAYVGFDDDDDAGGCQMLSACLFFTPSFNASGTATNDTAGGGGSGANDTRATISVKVPTGESAQLRHLLLYDVLNASADADVLRGDSADVVLAADGSAAAASPVVSRLFELVEARGPVGERLRIDTFAVQRELAANPTFVNASTYAAWGAGGGRPPAAGANVCLPPYRAGSAAVAGVHRDAPLKAGAAAPREDCAAACVQAPFCRFFTYTIDLGGTGSDAPPAHSCRLHDLCFEPDSNGSSSAALNNGAASPLGAIASLYRRTSEEAQYVKVAATAAAATGSARLWEDAGAVCAAQGKRLCAAGEACVALRTRAAYAGAAAAAAAETANLPNVAALNLTSFSSRGGPRDTVARPTLSRLRAEVYEASGFAAELYAALAADGGGSGTRWLPVSDAPQEYLRYSSGVCSTRLHRRLGVDGGSLQLPPHKPFAADESASDVVCCDAPLPAPAGDDACAVAAAFAADAPTPPTPDVVLTPSADAAACAAACRGRSGCVAYAHNASAAAPAGECALYGGDKAVLAAAPLAYAALPYAKVPDAVVGLPRCGPEVSWRCAFTADATPPDSYPGKTAAVESLVLTFPRVGDPWRVLDLAFFAYADSQGLQHPIQRQFVVEQEPEGSDGGFTLNQPVIIRVTFKEIGILHPPPNFLPPPRHTPPPQGDAAGATRIQ